MAYLNWDTKTVTDFSPGNIARMYGAGYVFTRVDKGVMNETRSFRIDLSRYSPTSENRRILRKSEHLSFSTASLPYEKYSWQIGKLAKDFYEKFGDNVFTANKAKEIFTDGSKSNFNFLLIYTDSRTDQPVGYAVCYESDSMIHYSYPFYAEDPTEPSRGLGMMTKAIEYAKASGKEYIYLGSLQRPSDTYKLQFEGGEWFDGKTWRTETEPLKEILKQ